MQISQDVASLDDPAIKFENTLTIKEMIEDERLVTPIDDVLNSSLKEDLESVLSGLEDKDADVIRCRFGLGNKGPMTLKEIGAHYNLSRERVRQIEKRAMLQLQQSQHRNRLKSYIA